MGDKKILPIKDINGKEIYDGDTVLYNGNTFVIMYQDKGDVEWILHPCNNNQLINNINIPIIPISNINEEIKLELIWNSLVKK